MEMIEDYCYQRFYLDEEAAISKGFTLKTNFYSYF